MSKAKQGKAKNTPWGSGYRAAPEVLHGYTTKVKGKTAEERLDMRAGEGRSNLHSCCILPECVSVLSQISYCCMFKCTYQVFNALIEKGMDVVRCLSLHFFWSHLPFLFAYLRSCSTFSCCSGEG